MSNGHVLFLMAFLFTDAANPTSNHIYQEVGYRPVRDETLYRLAPQAKMAS